MRLYDAAAMREADRLAIEDLGIPGPVLMESAARAAFADLMDALGDEAQDGVTVLAGRGNNGGDGHVIARYLHDAGIPVRLVLTFDPSRAAGDAALHLGIARRCGVPIEVVADEAAWAARRDALLDVGVVVDALLGTGLSSPVTGLLARIIEDVNAGPAPVFAVDVPSGIDATTGQVQGVAVRAARTVTFAGHKLGLAITPGCEHAGPVTVAGIGIPRSTLAPLSVATLTDADIARALLPPRPFSGHKGTFGHLLVVAGGNGKLGAAALTATAALRSGAGLVTLAVPRSVLRGTVSIPAEVMVEAIPDDEVGHFVLTALPRLLQLARGKDALAVGPGLGTHPEIESVVRALASLGTPLVVDADGLNVLAADDLAEMRGRHLVMTPHPGEMARLLDRTVPQIQADRAGSARALAQASGGIALLKGARSLIADADRRLWVNPTGNPGMGTGGVGDVLTGILGGLLAQGLGPADATVLGAYLHGLTGDLAARDVGGRAMVAGDLIDRLGEAYKAIEAEAGDERP